jgi:poly(A) polymerase
MGAALDDASALRIAPPAFVQDPALLAVLRALPEARLVGGCVRDTLAGRAVADVDLATPRLPEQVIAALQAAGLRAVPTGIEHGTITAVSGGRGFEVTTLRRDVATDGRRAVVAFTDDWRADAARRDFTINAMSMTPDGAVFDYFGGLVDLAVGRIRFVGDPATRIAEDYLRVLRFFRFHARYARVDPEPGELAALSAAAPQLARLSAERVWSELKRILQAPDPRGALALMAQLGVLQATLTEGTHLRRIERMIAAGAPPDPVLRLAALLAGDAEALAVRLRLSAEERDQLIALRATPVPYPTAQDLSLRRMLAEGSAEVLIGRAWIAAAAGPDGPDWDALRVRLQAIPRPVFPLEGRDALALGFAQGPEIGRALRAVRGWWIAGGCVADAARCRAELARLRPG